MSFNLLTTIKIYLKSWGKISCHAKNNNLQFKKTQVSRDDYQCLKIEEGELEESCFKYYINIQVHPDSFIYNLFFSIVNTSF